MNDFFKRLFGKPNEDNITNFNNSNLKFIIKIDNLKIGYLNILMISGNRMNITDLLVLGT